MATVVSYGGGVNSGGLLCGMEERGERPDAILFSDTKGEREHTYRTIEAWQEWCGRVSFPPITIVGYDTSKHASLEQECLTNETLPSLAFGFKGCSVKWKRQPMDKWVEAWPAGCRCLGARREGSAADGDSRRRVASWPGG